MNTLIVTVPIRPSPSFFPPFAILTLMKYLRRHGIDDVALFNIDGERPSYEQVLQRIRDEKPDVLGISAVVSTSYEYAKKLSNDVKAMLPETMIVLGGNMAASAEILLRKTGVDLCVVGEGEMIFLDVVRRAAETRDPIAFRDIKGLMLLDENDKLINTGYRETLPKEELYDIDWDDLITDENIESFLPNPYASPDGLQMMRWDPRVFDAHRKDKRIGSLYASKGCVSRCTFCHRWDKGIRFIPVDVVMRRIEELVQRFNVGMVHFVDENFGTDQRWLSNFCAEIKKFDVLWWCGTRVRGMTPEVIEMMKDAGCVYIGYGNETGSERMLEIMEKKVTLQQNFDAMRWTIERKIRTVVQLVIGMPGESGETINETIEFCSFANTIAPYQNPNDLSVNYAQALPGTPLYEYARHKGMIGRDIDGEEDYLLRISDRDAHDEYTTLNFTEFPKLMCETWRPLITISVNYAFVRKYGIEHYRKILVRESGDLLAPMQDDGYHANPKRLLSTESPRPDSETADAPRAQIPSVWRLIKAGKLGLALICHPILAYRARKFLLLLSVVKNLKASGITHTWGLVREYLVYKVAPSNRLPQFTHKYLSLRKIVDNDLGDLATDDPAMQPLRKAR